MVVVAGKKKIENRHIFVHETRIVLLIVINTKEIFMYYICSTTSASFLLLPRRIITWVTLWKPKKRIQIFLFLDLNCKVDLFFWKFDNKIYLKNRVEVCMYNEVLLYSVPRAFFFWLFIFRRRALKRSGLTLNVFGLSRFFLCPKKTS